MKGIAEKIKDGEWIVKVEVWPDRDKLEMRKFACYPVIFEDIAWLEKHNMNGKEVDGDFINEFPATDGMDGKYYKEFKLTAGQKLMKLSIGKSNWMKDAKYRIENRRWLQYSSQIARRVLAAMDEQGLTQTTLAEKFGKSVQWVSKIVKGSENLTLETIARLSDVLDIDLISFPEYKYSKPLVRETDITEPLGNWQNAEWSKEKLDELKTLIERSKGHTCADGKFRSWPAIVCSLCPSKKD